MESPVVIDKPAEYHANTKDNERGFPFDEEEGSGAWSELAARHPDIAARLRQRPANWARKRRPSSQDATEDFGDRFEGFDRFPFDDIPPEFREHFPTHWNRRFNSRDEQQPQPQQQPSSSQQHTTATQTEESPGPSDHSEQTHLPQYGLRNTVDLGQKSPADPTLVDAEERNRRSVSAPPDSCSENQSDIPKMSAQNHQEQTHHPQHPDHPQQQQSNVRHIPIFVEGRDEPVINKNVDHSAHFGDAKPSYVPPPPQQQQPPHMDRERYFPDDGPVFNPPPNFSRSFGTPFNKGFRQGPQPFAQQKVYPQAAFNRGASPQRSQSPKPQMPPEEHYVKVPVHHENKQEPPRPQQQRPQQQQPPPPQCSASQHQQSPPPQPKPQQQNPANDPITLILGIQTDVLNLMTDVENFTGSKKDKRYLYLDEMLTRNLIKLDNIETDGKENIRQARKEAIRCIQKCIAVLEAKAEKGSAKGKGDTPQPQDVDMNNTETASEETTTENGVEVEMKETSNEEAKDKLQTEQQETVQPQEEQKAQVETESAQVHNVTEKAEPQTADTRPEDNVPEQNLDSKEKKEPEKPSPKKGTKNVKKRDKSKDKKEVSKDVTKDISDAKVEVMQTDDKSAKADTQAMEVDGAASQ